MSNRIVLRLIFARRAALASGAFLALAAPVVSDMINAHVVLAQSRPSASAQPAPSARPNFEVASIKPCKEGSLVSGPGRKSGRGGEGRASSSPGRLSFGCQTVESLIQEAYLRFMSGKAWPADPITGIEVPSISNRLLHQSIQGGPGWIASDRYTIEAKAAGPETPEMMRGPMMQALLEDRFRLKIHRETRDVPVYALTVGKDGPKLQSMKPGSCVRIDFTNGPPPPPGQGQTFCGMFRGVGANGGMDTYGQTMAQLCRQFSVWLDRDVVNRTGIAGAFDIHLALSIADVMTTGRGSGALGLSGDPAPPTTPPDPLGAISAAVQKLGLKLAPAKEPAEFLVIDHVERPSEN